MRKSILNHLKCIQLQDRREKKKTKSDTNDYVRITTTF